MVRVKRILSRFETKPQNPKTVKIGSLEINAVDFAVRRNDKDVVLTEKEKSILKLLVNNTGVVLSHSVILDDVWGQDNIVEYGNIDVHIRHLREKVEKNPDQPQLIKTVKGKGYKFEY